MTDRRLLWSFGTRRHQPINCGKKRDRSTRSSRSLWKQKRYDSSEIFSTIFSMENVESDGRVEKLGEEVEEEEKIEQFFSLIRRFREAYDRRKRELNEMEERMRRKRKKAEDEQSSWVPTFQPEDFNDEIEFRRPPVISTGGRKENKKVEDLGNDGGLNLKLSL